MLLICMLCYPLLQSNLTFWTCRQISTLGLLQACNQRSMNTSSITDNMQHLYPIQSEVMLCAGEEKTPTHCPLTYNEFWPMDISSYAPVYRKLRVCMSLHSQGLFYGKKARKNLSIILLSSRLLLVCVVLHLQV